MVHDTEHLAAETIYALLDDRLDAVRARQVESHLWRCEPCRALREECGALRNALAWYAAEPPGPPEGYWKEFWRRSPLAVRTAGTLRMAGTRTAGTSRPGFRRVAIALAPALAVAASLLLLVGLWRTGSERPERSVGPEGISEPSPSIVSPVLGQAEWADDYDFFEQVTIAVGSVDPMSKGVVLASLAQAP
ncbi:MAG TPA: zf-HC2 domain-containing protein [Gemmatimonadota bacterium]|nr:zf-HC2 domain-containing protein [Gemmatimonadota bacterium]